MRILTQEPVVREEQNWLTILKNAISDPKLLLKALNLLEDDFEQSIAARKLFPLRVPQPFVDKMEKGNPQDPLFLQVMCSDLEFVQAEGFSTDPLEEIMLIRCRIFFVSINIFYFLWQKVVVR